MDIEYKTYMHKDTKLFVKAVLYKKGMEDGEFIKPYIIAYDMRHLKKIIVKENEDYIVLKKSFSEKKQKEIEYKFIFKKEFFEKFYKEIKE